MGSLLDCCGSGLARFIGIGSSGGGDCYWQACCAGPSPEVEGWGGHSSSGVCWGLSWSANVYNSGSRRFERWDWWTRECYQILVEIDAPAMAGDLACCRHPRYSCFVFCSNDLSRIFLSVIRYIVRLQGVSIGLAQSRTRLPFQQEEISNPCLSYLPLYKKWGRRVFRNPEIPNDRVLLHRLKKHHPTNRRRTLEQTQRNIDPHRHSRSSATGTHATWSTRLRQYCSMAGRIFWYMQRAHSMWSTWGWNRNLRRLGMV